MGWLFTISLKSAHQFPVAAGFRRATRWLRCGPLTSSATYPNATLLLLLLSFCFRSFSVHDYLSNGEDTTAVHVCLFVCFRNGKENTFPLLVVVVWKSHGVERRKGEAKKNLPKEFRCDFVGIRVCVQAIPLGHQNRVA